MKTEPVTPTDRAALYVCALLFGLCGGTLALPGVVIDHLLGEWNWSPADFGTGVMVLGIFAWLGTRIVGRVVGKAKLLVHPLAPVCVAVGLTLLYLFPLPLLGFACMGGGVGGTTMLGNALVVGMKHASRKLSVVNMCFTAGAVAMPAVTALLLNASLASEADAHALPWQSVPALMAVAFVALALTTGVLLRMRAREFEPSPCPGAKPETAAGAGHDLQTVPPIAGLGLAGLALFCYLGTEINLSNNWMPILHEHFQLSPELARLANPVFWSGLLVVRLGFTIWHPPDERIAHWLRSLGWMSVVVVLLALLLALTHPIGSEPGPSLFGALLALCFLSGFAVGSSYSFTVALVASRQRLMLHGDSMSISTPPNGVRRDHQISLVLGWGIAGSITLPLVMGFALEHAGPLAGLGLVFVTQIVFTAAVSRLHAITQQAIALKSDKMT